MCLDSSPFLLSRFSYKLYFIWTYTLQGTKSPQYVCCLELFSGFDCVKATFAIHAQEKAISGPCQGTGRKTPLSKWRLVGYRTWCQHVTLTRKPLGPVHTSYCYDFSSACPWVNKLCSFMWMQAESVFYKREVSSTLCCVTHWVCQGKVVPCKADKGTAIGSLRHHDKDGDSESADLCRYCH